MLQNQKRKKQKSNNLLASRKMTRIVPLEIRKKYRKRIKNKDKTSKEAEVPVATDGRENRHLK